uniref:Uncharacterized protein n=1 Tax=Anopheles dirus TaxID=7168 RepID=A0A182NEN4_9DIPT
MYAAHFYVFTPFLSTLYTLYGATKSANDTIYYTLHMEENFYGLPIRTSAVHYLLFGSIMTPLSYLCAYTGTVKLLTIWNLTAYCIVYFQLVQAKLQEVARGNTLHQELKRIVAMHQEALNCAKLLESVTSLVLLQQLILCVLIWSSMLLFFTVSGFTTNFMNLFVLFAFNTTETFGYCYLGQQLCNESARVVDILHESMWETQKPAFQKDLQLMFLRAQQPVGISAGKFCFMNMEQFGK